MLSRWNDEEARDCCRRYEAHGEALALRVYTSRLIGRERTLVLHGGGNTSVKTRREDLLGNTVPVLCVKGSGSDLASYVLFERPYCRALMRLGYADAMARRAELERFFGIVPAAAGHAVPAPPAARHEAIA